MDLNQIISSAASVASIAALVLAFIAAIYSLYKFLYRAKFRILHLPDSTDPINFVEIDSSHIDELSISKNASILEIPDERYIHCEKVVSRKKELCIRNRKAKIAFIIQNVGNRESGDIKLILRFDNPDIQIIDLHKETFEIEHFYNARPGEVKSKLLQSENMDSIILQYYEQLGMTSAHLSMETSFSGGAFELVVIEISLTKDIEYFTSVYRIECVNAFLKRQVLVQYHELVYS